MSITDLRCSLLSTNSRWEADASLNLGGSESRHVVDAVVEVTRSVAMMWSPGEPRPLDAAV